MKTLLWAVAVLALEVLLLSGYFAVVGVGQMVSTNVALALLVGTVSVMVWLGFKNDFEWTLKRILLAVGGCVILTYAAMVVVAFVDLPTALVCERGRTEVEATPHILGGRFEERRVGPCVFYNPESRPVPGLRGGGD
ncbi:MAG: hypothetical protein K0Q96_618 [Rubrobacteraceae bacterium]|jgi:hypothetical protein|nr:hypothetical protein [Rubrobacteraceae bacterium]